MEEDWMTIADYYSPKKVSDTLYSHTYVFFSFSAYFDKQFTRSPAAQEPGNCPGKVERHISDQCPRFKF